MDNKVNLKSKEAVIAYYLILITSIATMVSDGMAKYNYYDGGGFYRYSLIVRGILQLTFIGHLLSFFNKERLALSLSIISLILFFFVGQYALSIRFAEIDVASNFIFCNRFLYPLTIGGVFLSIRNRTDLIFRLWTIIRYVLLVNSFLIVIGLVLDIKFLRTYPDSFWKFGFDGLIFAQNEASYFYILGLLITYYDTAFLSKRKLLFGFILVVSMLIGTKAIYLFLAFLFVFHFIYFFTWKKLAILFLVAFFVAKFFVNDELYEQLGSLWSVFMRYYHQEGIVTALLSGRDSFIISKMFPLFTDYWSVTNFFFGGHDILQFYMEMGFFDLFLMYGGIGTTLYLITYSYFVAPIFRKDRFWIFSIFVLFVIVFTAGHFFESPANALYVAFFGVYIKQMNKVKNKG